MSRRVGEQARLCLQSVEKDGLGVPIRIVGTEELHTGKHVEMTWKKSSRLAVLCTLLSAVAVVAADGHEAHRKKDSTTAEAIQKQTEPDSAETVPEQLPVEAATGGGDRGVGSSPAHESHAHAEPPRESLSILCWLGRIHPMVIHFPIALFLVAFVAEVLFAATGDELFRHALRFTLWGAVLSAAMAAPLGWLFAASGDTEGGWILEAHRWTGTAALLLGAAVLWIGEHTERTDGGRLLLRVSLALQATLIGSVGFLGGSLLYGIDHLWRRPG